MSDDNVTRLADARKRRDTAPKWAASMPPDCPVTGTPMTGIPGADMCSCGLRHIRVERWGGGGSGP
jgi:hypothetical protein